MGGWDIYFLKNRQNHTEQRKKFMKKILLIIIILVLSVNGFAQNYELGSWNILNLKYNYSKKWSAFGEAQLRSLKLYSNPNRTKARV